MIVPPPPILASGEKPRPAESEPALIRQKGCRVYQSASHRSSHQVKVPFVLQNAKGTLFTLRAPYCEHLTRSPSFWGRLWYTIPDDFSSKDNDDREDHSDDDDHHDDDDDDDDNDDDDDHDDNDDSIDSDSEGDGLERKRKTEESGSTPNKRVKR